MFHQALVAQASPRIRRLAGSRAREMQFHRFLRNARVSVREMAETVGARTGERARGRDILLIQDTSEIVLGGPKVRAKGFGAVGKGGALGGVLLHAAIAVDATDGALLGLVDLAVWNRTAQAPPLRGRSLADKESRSWSEDLEHAAARLPEARALTAVMDAEGDIYEVLAGRPARVHVIVRSARDRLLAAGATLYGAVEAREPAARITRTLPARPGRKPRAAQLALRLGAVTIQKPAGLPRALPRTLDLHVVDVREEHAPEGIEPVHWLLLTTQPVATLTEAEVIIDRYRSRWIIEQLFRTIKSGGFQVEDTELEDPAAVVTFVGLATIAAVTVMQLVQARDGTTGRPLEDSFEPEERPLLEVLSRRLEGHTARQKNPHPPGSLAFASWVIARLGGWTGYYGKPGPAVMRHGLDRYQAIAEGWSLRDV